jgi:two-component system sensor histidine kinase ChvG
VSWGLKLGSWFVGGRWGAIERKRVAPGDTDRAVTHLRPSLRTNVLLMAMAMLVMPQLVVAGWSMLERDDGAPRRVGVVEMTGGEGSAEGPSRGAVRTIYDLRHRLARVTLVMLPIAVLFSWWMGRRMVRPIEWLRASVLDKARSANARADIALDGSDEVHGLATAFNDLLTALDERRRANEAFVADLVHEFKSPVSAIRACAESLEAGAVDEKRAVRLSKILSDSSGKLDALVSQFLELARAEAGMPKEERTEIDVADLVRGIGSALAPAFAGVRFVLEAEADARVVGVAPRIDSLVRNLVDNAASFAGDGGEVRVVVRRETTRAVTRDPTASGDLVVLEVSDTGPGIAVEDLPHVFDRFFTTRARSGPNDPSVSRRDGSGLGLALVKAIAEAHGGEVSAHAAPGGGATFRVTLPLASKQ